jgi:hypothetical protein
VVRHPIAVAYATKRWSRIAGWIPPQASRRLPQLQAPLHTLLRHWIEAHERFLADAPALKKVRLVRYEDLVADPPGELQAIFRFLGLEPVARDWEVRQGLNERYFDRWRARARSRRGGAYLDRLVRAFENRVQPLGYSLVDPERLLHPQAEVAPYLGHPALSRPREA